MSDRTDPVETLSEAARGWRELGARIEETVQAVDRQIGEVLGADWRGSGAEGFAAQWALLRTAVVAALPAFETAAVDLQQAAQAAHSVLGEGTGGGESSASGQGLGGEDAVGETGSAGTSSGEDSTSALNAYVREKLGEGLTHGSLDLGSGTPADSAVPDGRGTDDALTGGDLADGSPASGGRVGDVPTSEDLAGNTPVRTGGGSAVFDSAARDLEGAAPGDGGVPGPTGTESVVVSLSRLAATIATVFDRTGTGAGSAAPPLPSTPYDAAFLRRPGGMLGGAVGAGLALGEGPGDDRSGDRSDDGADGASDGVGGDGRDGRPAEDAGSAPEAPGDEGATEGSRIDSDVFPDTDPAPDGSDGRPDPEGVDPDPRPRVAPGSGHETIARGVFG